MKEPNEFWRSVGVSRVLAAALFAAMLRPGSAVAQTEYAVPPQQVDSAVTQALDPHYVAINRNIPRKGILYVHLPGSNLAPQGSRLIVRAAASAGFHAVGLMYPNTTEMETFCGSSTDRACFEKVHQEIVDGIDASPLLTVGRADSIEGRLGKLLQYLDTQYPADGWKAYLDSSGKPAWSRVNLSGFSQGSSHAAYIASSRAVNRLALYAGPAEQIAADGSLPSWITGSHATPAAVSFAFVHQQNNPELKIPVWRALGMEAFGPATSVDGVASPYGGSHMFLTNVTPAQPGEFHKSVTVDDVTPKKADGTPLYADVWSLMGGFNASAPTTNGWILPSSARVQGAGGAFYTTDLVVANTGTESVSYTLKFLGNGVDGRSGVEKTFSLGAGGTVVYSDVLGSVFDLASGFGALRIASASSSLIVTGQTSTPGFGGSFGQSVPALGALELGSASASRSIVGVREDGSFRTNLFLANATEAALAVDVTLVSLSGQPAGTKKYDVPPLGMIQVSRVVRDLGVTANVNGARLLLSTSTAGGSFAAYASTIDNTTNDPRTLLSR